MMTTLFEQRSVNKLTLRNRLVRSATWEGMCDPDGRPTKKLTDCYATLARGGVGLIISGYTYISPEGKQLPGQMGLHSEHYASDFERLTQAVHDAGGALAVQLVHTGGQADTQVTGQEAIAPSAVPTVQYKQTPSQLTKEQINGLVTAFGKSAQRAKQWGFDAVQLHGAHGYLVNQFLSPLTNQRTDDYGGSIKNRCRFMLQIIDTIRRLVGPNYPIMIKLNAADNLAGGLQFNDALYAAAQLDIAGIDAIEVSAGTPASAEMGPARAKINTPQKEAYNLDLARQIKAEVKCPVMVVGGFRSYDVCEKAVLANGMDFVAMSRPLIRQPELPMTWQKGDRRTAKCVSCNKCFIPGLRDGGIYCMVEKKESSKQ
jgi:2,4-dienoyl-CoA reductase-like NADH-dependent reductase (Old Yellow Enzyme family)